MGRSRPHQRSLPVAVLAIFSTIVALSIVGFRSESHRVQLGIACFALALNLVAAIRTFSPLSLGAV